uniref:p1 protein-P2 fusion protein n=1 Tax=Beet western yellows virus TaxID=12042 RepID=D7EZH6_9VIRU|nr:P1 protein-P2 fusion protein [Beet western yellows virus]
MTTSMLTFFLLASLCSLASSYAGTSVMSPGIANATDWPGYIEPVMPHCTPQVQLTYDCPPSKTLQDYSSHDMLQEVWGRGLTNTRTFWQEAKRNFIDFYQSGVQVLSATSHKLLKQTLRGISYVWSSLIWASLCALWYLVREYTVETLILGWLYILTVCMVKAVAWTFGASPIFLFNIGLSTLRGISRILWFRRPYKCEKSVEGFLSFKIPQSPPKHSVLQVQHPDGSHAGYAKCVMLYNGTTGLLTARHVVSSGCKVTSTRNGNKIPLSEFKVETESSTRDLLLMAGPPNWEGTLACKAVHFQTAPYLCKCKATFFAFNEGAWESSNAEIAGASPCRNFVSVLSITDPGHSGTPYFNGKTLLGVHVGGAKEENANYMAPIPPRAGLTTPNYVFETTAPQGRIFTEEEILELAEDFSYSEIHSIMAAQKGKAHYDMETTGGSGKREGGRARRNNRNPQRKHPHSRRKQWRKSPPSCCSYYTEGTLGPRCQAGHIHAPDDEGRPGCWCEIPGHDCFFRRYQRDQRSHSAEDRCSFDREAGRGDPGREGHEETPESRAKKICEQAENFCQYFSSLYRWESGSGKEAPGFEQTGSLPQFYHPKQKGESRWGAEVLQLHPELEAHTRGFGWPQFGAQAELKSLRLQAARWLERAQQVKIPSSEERERVIRKCCEAYKNVKSNGPNATRGNKLSWGNFLEDFKQAVFSLEFDAGIGVPYVAYGKPTHRGWVENHELLPILARLTFIRLQKMLEVRFEDLTPEQLVQQGLCDPIRVFVKGEPHKQSKLDEGRYRLIMSVSLVDQLVARVLFQNQNKREITLWRAVPSKPGFGLSTDEQVAEFVQLLSAQVQVSPPQLINNWRQHLVATDCSGFDWSVSDWLLEDDMEVRNRLTTDLNETTSKLRAAWLKCISNSVLCLSDGTLLAQRVPGVQKSGSYNTSSSNSRIRVMAAFHCGAEWAMAMGDDALESVSTDLGKYAALGFKVEESSKLEFCSHIFEREDLAIPVNKAKMIYKLIHGYEPECGNAEVLVNYLTACFAILNELRSDPQMVQTLYTWLVEPVQPQNN